MIKFGGIIFEFDNLFDVVKLLIIEFFFWDFLIVVVVCLFNDDI